MIKNQNLYLRPLELEDLSNVNLWKNDEETFKYLGGGFMPTSIDEQRKWMPNLIENSNSTKRFMICLNSGKPIGVIGIYNINWIHRTCEIGVYLGDKNSIGKGYSTEACCSLEKYTKNYLNLRKIKLYVVKSNSKAVNLWKKLGYKKVGELVRERFIDGQYHNLIIMEKFLEKNDKNEC